MSARLLFFKQVIVVGLTLGMGLGPYPLGINLAHADPSDDFIKETTKMARGIADNSMSLLLLGAFQTALSKEQNLDPQAALKAMAEQGRRLQGKRSELARLYGQSAVDASGLTGRRLTELYAEYVSVVGEIASQRLTLDGIRRDAYAYRASILSNTDDFVRGLEDTCRTGLKINPYDKLRPSLQAVMPDYGFRVGFDFGGDGVGLNPERSGITLGSKPEDQAAGVAVFAGAVVLSTYAITGTAVLTTKAFGALAYGVQAAALGMALGITAVIAVIIIAYQLIEARKAAKKAVAEQRKMFEKRADHETVNAFFQEGCTQVRETLKDLRAEMQGLADGDPKTIQDFESQRKANREQIKNFAKVLEDYMRKSSELLKDDFSKQSEEEQKIRREKLDKSPEAAAFIKKSGELGPKEMANMIRFLMKDFYQAGVTYSRQVEQAFQKVDEHVRDRAKSKEQASLMRRLATQQNLAEMELSGDSSLQEALKNSEIAAGFYAELDALILLFGETLLGDGAAASPAWDEIGTRIFQLESEVKQADSSQPGDKLISHIAQRLSKVKSLILESRAR